jgi:hypothetical protein
LARDPRINEGESRKDRNLYPRIPYALATRFNLNHAGLVEELQHGLVCAYCGATGSLTTDHIIPISRGDIDPRITKLLEFADNTICAWRSCNCSKGDKDVFEWYGREHAGEIPKLVLSKFLRLALDMHETQGTLDLKDPNMDGILDIFDLGVVITHLSTKISGKAERGPAKPSASGTGKSGV